jgi:hypothetical protein
MLTKPMRHAAVTLAVGAMVAGGLRAEPLHFPGRKPDSDVCAAERAPILERQRQYAALRRTRLAKAAGEGIKKGAAFFAGAMLDRYGGSSSSLPFGLGGGKTAATVSTGGFLNSASLAEAGSLAIPGVTLGSGGLSGANALGGDTKAIAAVAVVVAIAGTVEAYVRLKLEEANGDRFLMARSIEDDAGHQIPVSRAIAQEEAALTSCMQRQITDVTAHLASASNTKDRRDGDRDRASLVKAIRRDVDLTDDVCNQQATLAKTFTQGRAMTEGRSEAEVLGGQKPAYANAASTARLEMPAPDAKVQKASAKAEPPPPPAPTYSASRAIVVRAAPDAKAKPVGKLAAGAPVSLQGPSSGVWVGVQTAAGVGYVMRKDLAGGGPAAAAAPSFVAPTNVRDHNRAVLEARDEGPNRLKSLLTNIQAT